MDIGLSLILLAGLVVAVGLVVFAASWSRESAKRAAFISRYRFPQELFRRIRWKNADLTEAQVELVTQGLRQYFLACLCGQRRGIAKQLGMPSRAVDDAWHEFIVMTRDYGAFCKQAFGRYLHHTPKEQMTEPTEKALANTLHQLRQPGLATSLAVIGTMPLLFAIDRELGVKDGYHYDAAALDDLEKVRHKMLADRGGGGDGGGEGGGGKDAGACDTAASCGGGGGSCGGGGCGSS